MSTFLRQGLCHQARIASVSQMVNSQTTNPANGFDWLFKCAPSFYINGDNVQVLEEPSEFYNTLKVNDFKLVTDFNIIVYLFFQ